MTIRPGTRIAKFIRTSVPLVLLCAMTSLPAAAVTVYSSPQAWTSSATQLTKAEKKQLKAAKKAERKARKLCKKRMKKARKLGQTYTCSPGNSTAEEVLASTPSVTDGSTKPPATETPPAASQGNSPASPPAGSQSKPPSNPPSNPPSTPPSSQPSNRPGSVPGPATGGETDGVIRNALVGPESVPGPFLSKTSEEGGSRELLAFEAPTEQVPEPGSLALLGAGLVGLSLAVRRRSAIAA